jgi:4-carboxymuconolactone decarboxylase
MARVPAPRREDLAPEDQPLWDEVWGHRTLGTGPQSVLMHVPPLAVRVARAGDAIRFNGQLPARDRELAMLATSREIEARFEWQAHEPIALKEGVRPEAIEAVRSRGILDGLEPREQIVIGVVRALYREHRIPDDLYQRALTAFGAPQLVELVVLAGHYGLLGFVLNGFEVDLPEGGSPTF